MLRNFINGRILICLLGWPALAMAQSKVETPMPAILATGNGAYAFQVDGKPFVVLGAQLWNSSSWPYILDSTWPLLKSMHCNTLEAPIYWQVMEPAKGIFHFAEVDSLLSGARRQGLHLILLWFGSFKNGSASYAPEWLLQNVSEYPRMQDASGRELPVLSVLSTANLNADKTAFSELMKHLRQVDGRDHTVIMVQVENEAGSLGTDRDYSPTANEVFRAEVPDSLLQKLSKPAGNWQKVFGQDAAESFNAFTIARYINEVALAGRQAYGLPLYVNDWLRENGFESPGEYPSGGATSNMLDIWKAAAPELSLLAPDIYQANADEFKRVCMAYHQKNNPLFIPEMGKGIAFARNQFYAIGDYQAMGIATYGIDYFLTDPSDHRLRGSLDPQFAAMADNYRLMSALMPVIPGLQASGKLAAAVEETGLKEKLIRMGDYALLFTFGFPAYKADNTPSGRVLVAQLGEDEFLLAGFDARFQIKPKYGSGFQTAEMLVIEEGGYVNGRWVRKRIWNGDEAYHSTLTSEGNILRIRLRKSNRKTN